MKYRPEIDGLRALAIVPVIGFHAKFIGFSGGYIGVDIFFVISGYLITTIIAQEVCAGRFSIINFYERRARRILPALFAMLAPVYLFSWSWLPPSAFIDFNESLVASSIFSSNLYFWHSADYFDTAAELKPLLHTWSLAVEEQYYIFFPVLICTVWKFGRYIVISIIALMFVLSLGLAEWGVDQVPSTAFYWLPFRGWEMLIGSLCALYRMYHPPSDRLSYINHGTSVLSIVMIITSVVSFNEQTPWPGLYALVPTVGTALIILFAHERSLGGRLLASRIFVATGLISYSAYLWHQPLLAFVRHRTIGEPSHMLLGLMVVLTFFLAYCSWRWIEAPFRNRSLINRNQIAVGSICGIVIAAGVGFLGGGQSEMLQVGWANPLNSPPQVALYDSDNEALRLQSWEPLRKKTGDANYSASNNSADYNAWFDPLDFRANLLLVGNSFSKDLYNTLSASRSVREQYELARFGVQIRDLSYGHAFFDSPNYRQANVVILVTRWTDADVENLASLLARVRHDGKTAGVVKAITEFPEYRYGAWNLADKIVFENRSLTNSETANLINKSYTDFVQNGPVNQLQIAHNLMIEEVSSNFPNVTVLDRMDYICAKQECIGSSPSVEKTFYDYGHHTLSGADIFGRQIDDLAWLDQVKTKAVR